MKQTFQSLKCHVSGHMHCKKAQKHIQPIYLTLQSVQKRKFRLRNCYGITKSAPGQHWESSLFCRRSVKHLETFRSSLKNNLQITLRDFVKPKPRATLVKRNCLDEKQETKQETIQATLYITYKIHLSCLLSVQFFWPLAMFFTVYQNQPTSLLFLIQQSNSASQRDVGAEGCAQNT